VRRFALVALLLGNAVLIGCGPPRLPPGTPPPEYETRSLPPWPAAAGGAGGQAPTTAQAPTPAPPGTPAGVPAAAAAGSAGTLPGPSPAAPGE
jgi:hypothetical protein